MRASSNASKPHSYGESFAASGWLGPSSLPAKGSPTPTPKPTRMKRRIGKYSASMEVVLVPTSRLELLRLFRPLAPQASVSTNFTTWARNAKLSSKKSLRHLFVRRCRRRRGRRLRRRWRGRSWNARLFRRRGRLGGRRGLLLLAIANHVDHAAAFLGRATRRRVCKRQAQHEEDCGEHACRARQEIRRAGGAEQTAGGAAAEAGAHVGALAVLEQHEADDRKRDEHMKDDEYGD